MPPELGTTKPTCGSSRRHYHLGCQAENNEEGQRCTARIRLGGWAQRACAARARAPSSPGRAPRRSLRLGAPAVLGRSGDLRDARPPVGPAALSGRARRPAVR